MQRKSRSKTSYVCDSCGHEPAKWSGRCDACGEWNTIKEFATPTGTERLSNWSGAVSAGLVELAAVKGDEVARFRVGSEEVNRVLGGGFVPGSVTLIAGDPGIGKSTLLLRISDDIASAKGQVVYVAGEESPSQIKLRAQRMGISGSGLMLLPATGLSEILQTLDASSPQLVIVDSIQTVYQETAPAEPGSISQIRECARSLLGWAKTNNVAVILSGHVTKGGDIAGPRILEHMVDVVLHMEGEVVSSWRLLRSIKNRFGTTNEVGVLEMSAQGLRDVSDPSRALLAERREGAIGSVPVCSIEGSRPLLVEMQALTNTSFLPTPRRVATGAEHNRLLMVCAVLTRRARIPLGNQDVIVNVTGGLRINEPSADLGMALAIASSMTNVPIDADIAAIGELGLTGEVRSVPQMDRRVREAVRLGLRRCLVPAGTARELESIAGAEIIPIESLAQAVSVCLPNAAIGANVG